MSSTRASSRCRRQAANRGSSARCSATGRSARYASAASSSTSRSRTAPSRARDSRRRVAVALRAVRAEASPKTRHAARCRRVATRILWTSSGSEPVARARFAVEHPGEVEAQHLAAGLGDVVVGQ